ncbi:MAG: tetratricopeptide repeat protein [Planctomycetaceae bacterium]|nr:tetratricopeptide repeat protein [Planctomycetaceae bacterium]
MSANFNQENWRKILVSARLQDVVGGPHLVDDDRLLNRWSMGALTKEEEEFLQSHLAQCAECRAIILNLLETGSLTLPGVEESSLPRQSTMPAQSSPWQRNRIFSLAMLIPLAAVMVLGGLIYLWTNTAPSNVSLIVSLEKQYQQGDVQTVFEQSRSLLEQRQNVQPEERTKLLKLMQDSGNTLANQAFSEGNLTALVQIATLFKENDIQSEQLTNLLLQAERGATQSVLLAQLDRLDRDYGFDLQGYSITKNLDSEDTQQMQQQYNEALRLYPRAIGLRLNYGQFLLEHSELDMALQQFNSVFALEPENVLALMGRGLTCFRLRRYDEAVHNFQEILKLQPDLLSAKINLAITYQKTGQKAKARTLWGEIVRQTTDKTLKQQIQSLLKRNNSNE